VQNVANHVTKFPLSLAKDFTHSGWWWVKWIIKDE